MRVFCHKRRSGYILMLLFVVLALPGILGCDNLFDPHGAGCRDTGTETDTEGGLPEDNQELLGWTEETHGDEAPSDYATVFDETSVKRIDIVFQSEYWQALFDNMTELYGEFGERGGFGFGDRDRPEGDADQPPGMPPGMGEEMTAACEGKQAEDSCVATMGGNEMDGICTHVPMIEEGLICIPESFRDMDGPPGGGMDMMESQSPDYQPCTVNFEGRTWKHVGMRFKGNSSLMSSWGGGNYKLPFRLDFDEFEDDYPEIDNQRFFGFDRLTFSSGWSDDSLIREKVVADIFRESGVPAARTAFYRVYIDTGEGPVYFGLYTMVEDPNGPMLGEQFGDDDGNLYKPSGIGATFSEFSQESLIKKTNEDKADWSDVRALFDALHADRSDAAAWREGLEAVFDVNGFLNYLAINTVVTNWDTYGRMSHNYYLYADPDDGLLHWIPWDNNMALSNGMMGGDVTSMDLSSIKESWPLIRFLMDDPVYRATYRLFVNETINGAFNAEKTEARFRAAHAMVAPYAVGPEGEQEGYTLLSSAEGFEQELDRMIAFADQRRTAATQFLEDEGFSSSPIVIDEIHYHPAIDQDQDEDDYEFIELTNTSPQSIDLSGYRFASGIDFTFPEGASIAAGEYLLICKNAKIYAGKVDQVFEWESGKLSNRSESLQLNDKKGTIADYVRYADGGYWPEDADGNGASLELQRNTAVNSLAENWKAETSGGSPGLPNE